MGLEGSISLTNVQVQKLQWPASIEKNIELSVLRLDQIHPIVSGNKWFKLTFFLEKARLNGYTGLVTLGGAFSNHLLATAYAGRQEGLKTAGFVRGEKPISFSPTLTDCAALGMELHFVQRQLYKDRSALEAYIGKKFPDHLLIPEGGNAPLGIKGAATIMDVVDTSGYTHLCCAAGTGTMMAGLATRARNGQEVIGIPVLKAGSDPANSLYNNVGSVGSAAHLVFFHEYHLGGYARTPGYLPALMNQWYRDFGMPTDQVYTAKLFFGVLDLVGRDYFPKSSRILIIHSGGLQGNRSLPENTLMF